MVDALVAARNASDTHPVGVDTECQGENCFLKEGRLNPNCVCYNIVECIDAKRFCVTSKFS
jgi:hypothetical protein